MRDICVSLRGNQKHNAHHNIYKESIHNMHQFFICSFVRFSIRFDQSGGNFKLNIKKCIENERELNFCANHDKWNNKRSWDEQISLLFLSFLIFGLLLHRIAQTLRREVETFLSSAVAFAEIFGEGKKKVVT